MYPSKNIYYVFNFILGLFPKKNLNGVTGCNLFLYKKNHPNSNPITPLPNRIFTNLPPPPI